MKKIQIIYDLPQYTSSLILLDKEFGKRGWTIVRETVSSYNNDKDIICSLGCQSGPWIGRKKPISVSFIVFHGVSFIKGGVSYAPGWDYVVTPSKFWTEIVSSELDLNEKLKNKPELKKRVLGLGWSKSDLLINNKDNMNYFKNIIIERHKLDKYKPIILVAPTYSGSSNYKRGFTKHTARVVSAINNYSVICMPHSMCNFKDRVVGYNVVHPDYKDKHEYLLGADILISDVSSLIFEFSLLNKPVILIEDTSIKGYLDVSVSSERVDIGRIVDINHLDILNEAICLELNNPFFFYDRRKYWVEKALGYCDGKSTERIVNRIEEIVGVNNGK